MLDWFTAIQLSIAFGAATILAILSFARRKPSLVSLSILASVELLLLVQLAMSIVLVSGGARAKTDTVEFFGYLVVALIVPPAAAFWALAERNRWSTMVLAVSAFTVAIMVARMSQIWLGN